MLTYADVWLTYAEASYTYAESRQTTTFTGFYLVKGQAFGKLAIPRCSRYGPLLALLVQKYKY
jgi:hypothetical protein